MVVPSSIELTFLEDSVESLLEECLPLGEEEEDRRTLTTTTTTTIINNNNNNNMASNTNQSPANNTRARMSARGEELDDVAARVSMDGNGAGGRGNGVAGRSNSAGGSSSSANGNGSNTGTNQDDIATRFVFPKKIEVKKWDPQTWSISITTTLSLKMTNEHDLKLAQLIWEHKPYIKPDMGKKWKLVVEATALQQDINGNNLFPEGGLNRKACTNRLKDWCDWYKNKNQAVPFQSGCDDEDLPTELEIVIGDIYEQKTSFEEGEAESRTTNAATQAQNRANALAIQAASLGNYQTPRAGTGRGSNRRGGNGSGSDSGSTSNRAASRNVADISSQSMDMAMVLEQHVEQGKKRDDIFKMQLEQDKQFRLGEQELRKRELDQRDQEREFQEKRLKQEGEFRAKELELQAKRDQTLQQTLSNVNDTNVEMVKFLGKMMDKFDH